MPIKFPLELNFIDVDGRDSVRNVTITISDPVTEKHHRAKLYRSYFKITIPDHIHKFLCGRTIPAGDIYGGDISPIKYERKFSKTLSGNTLIDVIRSWEGILSHYRWLRDIDKAGLDKVIYFEFETPYGPYKAEWNGKERPGGFISKIGFRYIIGYMVDKYKDDPDNMTRRLMEKRYDADLNLVSTSERKFYAMKWIKWTPEREAFFKSLQADFEGVIGRINEFESAITEKGIRRLMAGQKKLLGSGS